MPNQNSAAEEMNTLRAELRSARHLDTIEYLARVGNAQAVELLLDALHDLEPVPADHGARCERIAEALGVIGNPLAIPSLVKAIHDDRISPRDHKEFVFFAIIALGSLGAAGVDELFKLLRDSRYRTNAFASLEKIGMQVWPQIILLLTDEDDEICRIAAYLIARLKSPQTIPALIHIVMNPNIFDEDVRGHCFRYFRDAEIYPGLLSVLFDPSRDFYALLALEKGNYPQWPDRKSRLKELVNG